MDVAADVVADVVDWPIPRAAYIHVPFCRHRCGYCNFSVIADGDHYIESYLKALSNELGTAGDPRPVETLFIGGGTPTHLPTDQLAQLLDLVLRWHPPAVDAEFSIEANPTDITSEKLALLRSRGVNRISLGVQSFRVEKLKSLERDHDGELAERVIRMAAESIGNVSIDLIFAAPGEVSEEWQSELDRALTLPISHLSTYGLTYEKGTQFWNRLNRGILSRTDEEIELEMYKGVIRQCRRAGWEHYEVSNHARPGFRCRHNMAYWEGRGWYASGPGAAAFVDGHRTVNHRSPTTYIRKLLEGQSAIAESELLDRETWARERLVFGLRMLSGVDLRVIERETQFPLISLLKPKLDVFIEQGLLEQSDGRLKLTERGLYISDAILGQLL